ncbi:MAG: hypothetical protein E7350_00305 [Clostridiales bacterium]|nr:hypothetical protein [Clostridiales bacterium]
MNKENNKREKNNRFNALAGILILINYALIIGLIPIARYYPEISFIMKYDLGFWGSLIKLLCLAIIVGSELVVLSGLDLSIESNAFRINAIIEIIVRIIVVIFLFINLVIYFSFYREDGCLAFCCVMILLLGYVIVMNILNLIDSFKPKAKK